MMRIRNQDIAGLLTIPLAMALITQLIYAKEPADNPYQGLWLTEDAETIVRISSCKTNSLCGRIDGFIDKQENHQLTSNEEQLALKELKAICSTDLLGGVKKQSGQWKKGWIMDFENKKQYSVNLELLDSDRLKLRVYKGIKTFGKTLFWKRIDKTPVNCTNFL